MRLVLTTLALLAPLAAAQPTVEIIDKTDAAKFLPEVVKVEKVASGMKFTEGPIWFPAGSGPAADGAPDGYLLFSDIPSNHIKRWTPDGKLSTFRENSGGTNGNARDAAGLLLSCEGYNRRLTRTEKDGKVTVLADEFDGKKLSSPNDVAVHPSGALYFTDPTYGKPKDAPKEQATNNVYRLDPHTLRIAAVATDFDMPNGLALSPDAKTLYVADSGKPKHIRALPVNADGTLGQARPFCTIDKGAPDGIKVDRAGRVWSSSADGVQIFSPEGKLVARVLVPEPAANLAFGGASGNDLFVTSRTSLYRVTLKPGGGEGVTAGGLPAPATPAEEVITGMIGKLDEMTAALKTVRDANSSRAAAPRLRTIVADLKALKARADRLKEAPEQSAPLKARYEQPLRDASTAFTAEVMRIAADPALMTPELQNAFEQMSTLK
ncbi:MAG TPA: SMP-30/gluconolactonase/LRE family protein [Tepidisphaeraceae bacterium]|nr:SMP-30/gluconolactonase/LRE family protein [Tepidisphaeraceae bacterium]